MAKKESKGMIFFPVLLRWTNFMNLLTDEEAGILFKNMFRYCIDGIKPDFTNNDKLIIIWCDVESWLNTSKDNYSAKIQQTSEAGKRSAAKRKEATDVNERQRTLTKAKAISKEKEKSKATSSASASAKESAKASASNYDDGLTDSAQPLGAAGLDDDVEEIISYFKNHIPKYDMKDYSIIVDLCKHYEASAIKAAIDIGESKGARSAAYIRKVLESGNDYEKKNHLTFDTDSIEWEG